MDGLKEGQMDRHGQKTYIPPPSAWDKNAKTQKCTSKTGSTLKGNDFLLSKQVLP